MRARRKVMWKNLPRRLGTKPKDQGDAPRSLAITGERELNARRLRRENKNEYFESMQRQVLNEPEEIMICEEGFLRH
jgi:hypothetical protein